MAMIDTELEAARVKCDRAQKVIHDQCRNARAVLASLKTTLDSPVDDRLARVSALIELLEKSQCWLDTLRLELSIIYVANKMGAAEG